MKKISIYGVVVALMAGVMITSCKDDFTEEDALKDQQTIDLNVIAYDPNTGMGIPDATVIVLRDGKQDSLKTNAQGVAIFSDTKIGPNVPVWVKASGYTTIKRISNLNTGDYRVGQITETFYLYALTGPSTAVIRGKVEIETDLTNDKSERVPVGTLIHASWNTSDFDEVSTSTTVDANGNYSLVLPATKEAMNYKLTLTDLELDQKIAINGYEDDEGFPTVLPSIATIKTVFKTTGFAADIPWVRPVYAVIGAPNAGDGAEQAVAGEVSVNSDGEISFIDVDENGANYPTSVSNVPVTITSLTTGSGADIKANTNGDGQVNGFTYTNTGTGYPTTNNVNSGEVNPSVPNFIGSVMSGEIRVLNIHYGSGNFREKEIR